MLEKKLSRRQFLWTLFSLATLFSLSGLPQTQLGKPGRVKTANTYGNNVYGGITRT